MCETPSKMYIHDIVKINTAFFEIVRGALVVRGLNVLERSSNS